MRWFCVGNCQTLLLFYARAKRLTLWLSWVLKRLYFAKKVTCCHLLAMRNHFISSNDLWNTSLQILKKVCLMLFFLQKNCRYLST